MPSVIQQKTCSNCDHFSGWTCKWPAFSESFCKLERWKQSERSGSKKITYGCMTCKWHSTLGCNEPEYAEATAKGEYIHTCNGSERWVAKDA